MPKVYRFRPPPERVRDRRILAEAYQPGQPLGGLQAVCDQNGDPDHKHGFNAVAEVTFADGSNVLLVRCLIHYEESDAEPDYMVVKPGQFLVYAYEDGNLDVLRAQQLADYYDPE